MPFSENEKPLADQQESLRGWDLGVVLPERTRPVVFLPGQARCAVCAGKITDLAWHLFQTCDSWQCRAEHRRQQRVLQKEREEHQRRQREELQSRARCFRDEVARVLGIDQPERFAPAVVPAIERRVNGLPSARRSALNDHLRQLIGEACHQRSAAPRHPPPARAPAADAEGRPAPILERACAMCQGHCCVGGGDQAYLGLETMLHYLEEHPDVEAPEVRAVFLSCVQTSTFEESCIFHGERGCSLPREMRSGVCKEFECAQLRRLREEFSGPEPCRAFLIGAKGRLVVRYAFVDAS